VQQPDVRVGALDDLAVEFQHQAQHTVRGRVLGPEVQRVVLDLGHVRAPAGVSAVPPRGAAVVVFADDARRDLARLDRHRLVDHALLLGVVAHLDVARHREVLAQRMADEAVVGQDAAQVDMALEDDAEHVEGLALEPVGRRPQVGDRGHHGQVVVGREHLQAHAPVQAHRQQVRHDAVARTLPGLVLPGAVVDAAQVDQLLELQRRGRRAACGPPPGSRPAATVMVISPRARTRTLMLVAQHRFSAACRLSSRCVMVQALRAIVFSRRILACSCRMPYSSASAVGGQPGT
jgi:hypothetical protein